MDAFSIVILAGIVGVGLFMWLLGSRTPGTGSEQVGLRPGNRIVEEREALEADDLAQMLEASNARRRRRGERERSAEEIELQVVGDLHEQRRRDEAALAQRDLQELLMATNARRIARGLAPRTADDARRELGGGPA